MGHASVIATNLDTKLARNTQTTGDGLYSFVHLPPGIYSVMVAAPNFRRFTQTGVTLSTGERVRLDVRLEIGTVAQNVNITSDAPELQTESANLGQVIEQQTKAQKRQKKQRSSSK